jgi:PAS domain S-box-containing protein
MPMATSRQGEITPARSKAEVAVGHHVSSLRERSALVEGMTAAGVGEWDADLAAGSVALSTCLRRLLGLGEATSMSIEAFQAHCHPEDRERVARESNAALLDPGRGFFRNRFRIVRGDGGVIWIDARAAIIRDTLGRAERTVGVMFDVTDQVGREQALEDSKRRFEEALSDTAITLFQQDRELRYLWIHNLALGHKVADMLGRTDAELMDPELAARLETVKREVMDSGAAIRRELEAAGPGGLGRYDVHLEPLRGEMGAVIGITGAAVELGIRERPKSAAATRKSIAGRDLLLDSLAPQLRRQIAGDKSLMGGLAVLRLKLERFGPLAIDDIERLAALELRQRLVPARVPLLDDRSARNLPPSLIVSGWAVSYNLLAEGGRQVISFHLPGDLIGPDSGVVAVVDKTWATLTDCAVCEFDGAALSAIRQAESPLAEALRWSAARDEAIVQQHLISIGRRPALARVGHLLLELGERLQVVGLADEAGYRCPLRQEDIADALGLTTIHVNRMLRELRRRGLVTFRRGYVAFADRARLVELAEYNSSFLVPQRSDAGSRPAPL